MKRWIVNTGFFIACQAMAAACIYLHYAAIFSAPTFAFLIIVVEAVFILSCVIFDHVTKRPPAPNSPTPSLSADEDGLVIINYDTPPLPPPVEPDSLLRVRPIENRLKASSDELDAGGMTDLSRYKVTSRGLQLAKNKGIEAAHPPLYPPDEHPESKSVTPTPSEVSPRSIDAV